MDGKGKTALVTGASSGIGYQYALQLGAMGFGLVLVSNQPQELEAVAAEVSERYGVFVLPLCMDLARPEAAGELFDACRERGLEIEVLINNAGVFFFNDLTAVEPRRIEVMVNLHMLTVTLLCRYFGRAMQERGHGYMLNMSSMSVWMPVAGISVYAASKSYLRSLSLAIREELYDSGVRVTAVCPGAVATDLYNLSSRYQKLALRLGIMMTPEALAGKGLRALFRGRRSVVPGALNHVFIPLLSLVPPCLVRLLHRRAKFYRYGK